MRGALLALALVASDAEAQRCTYAGCPRETVQTEEERASVQAAVRAIAAEVQHVAGTSYAFRTEPKDWVRNANAYARDGALWIGYNPLWIGRYLNRAAGGLWPVRAVVAHEIGHHVLGHTRGRRLGGDRHAVELEADLFAGWILHGLGATRHEAQVLWRAFPVAASPTHPAMPARLVAVARGWDAAEEAETLDDLFPDRLR